MGRRETWEKMLRNAEESAIACALLLAAEFLFCSIPSVISKCQNLTIISKKNLTFLGLFDSLCNNKGGITKGIKQNFFT